MSPKRYTGWEATDRTELRYDAAGRLVELVTTHEPEWDAESRALLDVYADWRADLHTCGQPMSECLFDDEREEQHEYVSVTETCVACRQTDRDNARREKSNAWVQLRKADRHPETWTEVTVFNLNQLPPEQAAAIRADRKAAAEKHAALERARQGDPTTTGGE